MPFDVLVEESEVRLVLTGRLGVQQARALWDCLAVSMARAATINIDAETLVDMEIVKPFETEQLLAVVAKVLR